MKKGYFRSKLLLRFVSICLSAVLLGGQQLALAAGHFTDMPESHWAYSSVEEAYTDGAVSGRGGDAASGTGVFAPNEVVTYAEFVAMFMKAFYPNSIPAAQSGESWYAPCFKAAISNQLLTTDSLDAALAKAKDQINRYDMAEILVKILVNRNVSMPSEAELNSAAAQIADWTEISKDQNRAYYVSRAYAMGLISGTDDKGTFQGNAVVTRAVAAVIYSRTAQRLHVRPYGGNNPPSNTNTNTGSFTPSRNIDHIQQQLPDYAVNFYRSLEEATDNDGVNDYLIEDQYFTPGTTTEMLENNPKLFDVVHTLDGAFLFVAEIEGETDCSKESGELVTAYNLFRADYPEVFWLFGQGNIVFIDIPTIFAGKTMHHIFLRLYDLNDLSVDMRAGYTEQTIRENASKMNASIESIMAGMPEGGVAEQVRYFNQWLTLHNDSNTEITDISVPLIGSKSISALLGNTGAEGPVCSGYSAAMKALCDKSGIPCLMITGTMGSVYHAWNYVQIDGVWYAVDVAFNDPAVVDQNGNRIIKPTSGYEKEEYLLVGKNTANSKGESFEESHNLKQLEYPLKDVVLSSEAYLWN